MRIVINDANILIDLVELDLVNNFAELNFSLQTTDFVLSELHPGQNHVVQDLVANNRFSVIETSSTEDYEGITEILEQTNGLSIQDCSVWYYCVKYDAILLSGDGRLRRQASAAGVEVKGILYIFDQLLLSELIDFQEALSKITRLYEINERLPIEERDKRLAAWANGKHIA